MIMLTQHILKGTLSPTLPRLLLIRANPYPCNAKFQRCERSKHHKRKQYYYQKENITQK